FDCFLVPPKPVQLFYNNLIAPLDNRFQPMVLWPVKIFPTHLIGKHFIRVIPLDRIYLPVKMLVFCGYTDIRILHSSSPLLSSGLLQSILILPSSFLPLFFLTNTSSYPRASANLATSETFISLLNASLTFVWRFMPTSAARS